MMVGAPGGMPSMRTLSTTTETGGGAAEATSAEAPMSKGQGERSVMKKGEVVGVSFAYAAVVLLL
jgi:hypothetical protein